MASPLRFRRSTERWHAQRVVDALHRDLDANLGAEMSDPAIDPPGGFDARRFDMDNGDLALFAWPAEGTDPAEGREADAAYWLGNTETPKALWKTEKYTFDEVPYPVARWAQRILLADLEREDPWLAAYPYVAWFFLPVFFSKDGRETSRAFFAEHAAGFPDASREEGLSFYESVLTTGVLDPYRYEMAAKLGTSEYLDTTRMAATMGEFDAAKILVDAGYDIRPEHEVTTGHSLDFRVERDGEVVLVEVTRPLPPTARSANSPVAAIRETAETKTSGQLAEHGGGAVLFVDCTSFPDDAWNAVAGEQPDVRHKPAVVLRCRPDGRVEGYRKGRVPLDLDDAIEWV